jgi:hypothetical protein
MPLATLADVKAKLPGVSDSNDDGVQAVLDAADRWVRTRTRLEPAASTFVDTVERVRVGHAFQLPRRPVTSVTMVEGRWFGVSTWQTLTFELVDANAGMIIVPGHLGWEWWQMPEGISAPWWRWRDRIWPLIRVTYVTAGTTVPEDLRDSVAALAAYWYSRHRAGAAKQAIQGQMSETFLELAVPPWIMAVLQRYMPTAEVGTWV